MKNDKSFVLRTIALAMAEIKNNLEGIPTAEEVTVNANAMLSLAKAYSTIEGGAEQCTE